MNDTNDDTPPISSYDTKQLMTARMLFTTMLEFLKSTEFPLEGSDDQIKSVEDEIKEIDVELLTRDYSDE